MSCCVHSDCVNKGAHCPIEFVVPGEVIPYRENYKLGDTILIRSKFHREVRESFWGEDVKYDLGGLDFQLRFDIFKIDLDSAERFTQDYVDVLPNNDFPPSAEFYSLGIVSYWVDYHFEKDSFYAELRCIPKDTGLYVLAFATGKVLSREDFPGKCWTDPVFSVWGRLNGDRDNNIHLLKESPDPHFNTWILQKPKVRFYEGGFFAYRVTE